MYMQYKTYETYGGGNELVVDPDGYAKLVRHLAAQTFVRGENDPRLLLHETVRQVQLSTLESVYVRTAEGHEYVARYCIITFSVFAKFSPFFMRELKHCFEFLVSADLALALLISR